MNILGIDLGTVKTGVTHITGEKENPIYDVSLITMPEKTPIDERFLSILKAIRVKINITSPELVVCEYPFNIKGNARVLVELFGVVRFICLVSGFPFLELAQTKIKKYATGKGSAEKSDIRMQAYKEFALDLTEDEADSFFIAHFGMTYLYGTEKQFRQESVDALKAPKKKKGKKSA